MEAEEWRVIEAWPEYEVSSNGRVRRLVAYHKTRKSPMLKLRETRVGYWRAGLCKNSKVKFVSVHRLVAIAFLPPPLDGQIQVAHKNGIKSDNSVVNLRWDTASGNAQDRWVHGTYKAGEEHACARLTWGMAKEIRELRMEGLSLREIAQIKGISKTSVAGVVRGERWTIAGPNGQAHKLGNGVKE